MTDIRGSGVRSEAALDAVARLLESKAFARSIQLRRFLEFTTKETLAGRADEVKEYTIAVEAYRRPTDFDSRADPIVRTEAHRLRKKLEQYYASEGQGDPVRVTYPKGSYVPQFSEAVSGRETAPLPPKTRTLRNLASGFLGAPGRSAGSTARWVAVGAAAVALLAALFWSRDTAIDIPRIAVLPFEDRSEGARHQAIAYAASDSILAELTRWPGIEVASRGANLEPLDRAALPIEDFIERLNADYLLEGTFHRVGDQCRLNAQLVRSEDGTTVWAREYTFNWDRVFEIQLEIASDVAAEIGERVSPAVPASRQARSPEAYESYARARYAATQFGDTLIPEYLAQAERELARALALEPDYVDALALKAGLEASRLYPPGPGSEHAVGKMQEILDQTLALEPDHIPSLTLQAAVNAYRGEARESLRRTARAIELDPKNPSVHGTAGVVYRWFGFLESAVEANRRSIELRTLSALPYRHNVDLLDTLERPDEAAAALRVLKSLNVPGPQLANIEADHLLNHDDGAGALSTLEDALARYESVANTSALEVMYGLASALSGNLEEGRRALREHGDKPRYRDSLINLALVLGDTDVALSHIAVSPTARNYRWLATNRYVRPYLDRPEFRALSEELYAEWQRNLKLAGELLPIPPPDLPPPGLLANMTQTSLSRAPTSTLSP